MSLNENINRLKRRNETSASWRRKRRRKPLWITKWWRRHSRQIYVCGFIVIIVVIVAGPFLGAFILHGYALYTKIITTSVESYLQEIQAQKPDEFFANVRNLGLITLGVIGTILAVWRSMVAHSAHKLSEKGLIIDRYQKGSEMLESSELSVRIAGVYALRELALSDPEEMYFLVLDILYAFVREKSKDRQPKVKWTGNGTGKTDYGDLPTDLQSALTMTTLIRNSPFGATFEVEREWRVNLRRANLSGANLEVSNLSGANLFRAKLSGAKMDQANLSGANLALANLSGGQLFGADLSGANLICADLSGANLTGANLTGASPWNANLSGASFSNAKVEQERINASWAFENNPPRGLPEQFEELITYRRAEGAWKDFQTHIRPEETWDDFADRMQRERPEFGS